RGPPPAKSPPPPADPPRWACAAATRQTRRDPPVERSRPAGRCDSRARRRALPRVGRLAAAGARRSRPRGALRAVFGAPFLLRADRPLLQVLARLGPRDGPRARGHP